jgi:hypothetical protein
MSKKRLVFGLLGVGLLGTALTAGMCTPPGGGECTGEGDCTTEERCHPTLKICVPNCVKQTEACTAEKTCSEAEIEGVDFKNICICNATTDDCASGEKCNPTDRVCDTPCTSDADCGTDVYPGQSRTCQLKGNTKFCLPPAGSCIGQPATFCGTDKVCDANGQCIAKCTAAGGANPCPAGKYCDDGRWTEPGTFLCVTNEPTCSNDDCLTDYDGLCDLDSGNETYHQCVAPDDATNTCGAPGAMETGGPIMYVDAPGDIEEITNTADDPGSCIADGDTLMMVTLTVEGTLNTQPYQNTYWLDGSTWRNTTYFAEDGSTGGFTFLMIYMCFDATTAERAFYHDNGTGESNRVCVDF